MHIINEMCYNSFEKMQCIYILVFRHEAQMPMRACSLKLFAMCSRESLIAVLVLVI